MDFGMFHRTTHIRPFTRSSRHQPLPGDRQLRHGEIIKGTVIRQYPGNEVLVAVRGRQILANTKLHLIEGNRYHFLVNNGGAKTELKVINDPIQRIGLSGSANSSGSAKTSELTNVLTELFKSNTIKGISVQTTQTFKNLQKLFPAIFYSDKVDNSGLWFSRFIMASGLLWENKVLKYLLGEKGGSWKRLVASDLKGQLLSIEKSLCSEDNNRNSVKSMAAKVKQAISLIEKDQFQNLSGIRENPGWLVHIPGLMEDGFMKAELLFLKKEKKEGINFSIFLEFTRLGQIEFDVSIIDSVIGIKILTEDKEKADLIAENQNTLERALQSLGLKTGHIHCEARETQILENQQSTNVHLII